MKKFRIALIALSLGLIGVGTIYALTVENSTATEQIKIKRKCSTCNGTGKVKERVTHGPCQGEGCAACDYNGYVMYTVDYSDCGGTGWINVR